MLFDYPLFHDLTLPDQLGLAALEGQAVLHPEMLAAIQRAADLLGRELPIADKGMFYTDFFPLGALCPVREARTVPL